MNTTYTPPSVNVKVEIVKTPLQDGLVTAVFSAAAEIPGLGQAGKQAGEVILTGPSQILVSLGKTEKLSAESVRSAGGALVTFLQKNNVERCQLDLEQISALQVEQPVKALIEGLLLGSFRFDRYKSGDKPGNLPVVVLATARDVDEVKAVFARVEKVAEAVNLTRDWAHEPANVINPVSLAERVTDFGQRHNLKVTVIDDQALKDMGAGAILAVGKGSKNPSRLILIEYPGKGDTQAAPVVVVGKAITFDTGGYSIKTTDGIQGMKYDKSGAMTVVGVVKAAADLGLATPVVGVIAAAENMISGESYRPDDILTTLSGKTVEIISTDAEGRLVLADALTYAQKTYKPRAMVDLATLTGGVVTALGRVRAGVMSNNDDLVNALLASGETTFERMWRLPLDDEYDQQIKGDDADIKNSGGREAAPVIGGTFLKQFVDRSVPWAHIDIAAVATTPKDLPYNPKGATGFGVRLLVDYLESLEH